MEVVVCIYINLFYRSDVGKYEWSAFHSRDFAEKCSPDVKITNPPTLKASFPPPPSENHRFPSSRPLQSEGILKLVCPQFRLLTQPQVFLAFDAVFYDKDQ